MKLLRLALIGAGNRCTALYKADLKKRSDVEIVAVCDTCSEKSEKLASLIEADGRVRPSAYEIIEGASAKKNRTPYSFPPPGKRI